MSDSRKNWLLRNGHYSICIQGITILHPISHQKMHSEVALTQQRHICSGVDQQQPETQFSVKTFMNCLTVGTVAFGNSYLTLNVLYKCSRIDKALLRKAVHHCFISKRTARDCFLQITLECKIEKGIIRLSFRPTCLKTLIEYMRNSEKSEGQLFFF